MHQAAWPLMKFLLKQGGPRASGSINSPLCVMYHLLEKANVVVDCLENHFTPHDLYDKICIW